MCVTVRTTKCETTTDTEEIDICNYEYDHKELEAMVKVADVKYTKSCDTKYIEKCREVTRKKGYGKTEKVEECREIPIETCKNEPQ